MVVTTVVGALNLIMFSTLHAIKLVPAPWSAMSLDITDPSRYDASNSALSHAVSFVTLPFITLIFLLSRLHGCAIRALFLDLYCSCGRVFRRLKSWSNVA